jgi:hypothetical protein
MKRHTSCRNSAYRPMGMGGQAEAELGARNALVRFIRLPDAPAAL